MQQSHEANASRVERFVALYGYYRGLLFSAVLAVTLGLASVRWADHSVLSMAGKLWTVGTLGVLTILLWYRTKQRAFYYVREVLLTAERVLDGQKTKES